MNMVDAVLRVLAQDYVPFRGTVEQWVYEELGCRVPGKARWFSHPERPWICLGCQMACLASSQAGFQLMLPAHRTQRARVAFQDIPAVSVEQILTLKSVLPVAEAAYCLSVSERHIYDMIDDGRLEQAGDDRPVRVTTASVRARLGME